MTNAGHGVWRTGSVPANEKEKTPMKKKLLSLALVLAMALTLLPTVALAAHTPTGGTECAGTLTKHEAVAANCTSPGNIDYWACDTCSKNFSDADGTTEVTTTATSATGHSQAPADGRWTPDNSGGHYYICQNGNCPATDKKVTGTCDTSGTNSACSKCGYKAGGTDPVTSKAITAFTVSASGTVTAGGSVSFTVASASTADGADNNAKDALQLGAVTWKNAQGTALDPQPNSGKAPAATGNYTVEVAATIKSGNTAYTIENTVKGTGSVTVAEAGTDPDPTPTPTPVPTPTPTPDTSKDEDKAPSTNSQGIPVASEVSNSTQANQAITILKNTNADTLQQRLMTSESAASSFASLESAVKSAKGIRVSVDTSSSSAPSAVRSGVSVTGAAFNASGTSVRLVVDAPSSAYNISSGYQISMTMSGVSNPEKLAVPVIITLPVPSDVRADRLVVLHYHNGSSNPTTIVPVISGNSLRFTVTGFSDFVVTDADATVGNGVSGAYTTVQGGNRGENELDALLPAIAAMLSGDGVFVDVTKEHWAAKEIRWARDGGLMSGYENGYFRPTASTTRQQLWMVLARLSGTRPADMAMARQWAINTGVSDGSNPSGVLSRQQLVTMLYRFAKSQGVNVSASAKLGGYADSAAVAPYAKEALSWAAAKGIVSGSNGKLNPEGTATRAHFAVFLYRYSHG